MPASLPDHRKGLAIASIGAFVLTFDAPLVRIAQGETWTVIFWRGIMVFSVLFCFWLWARRSGRHTDPFINGWTGFAVACCFACANLLFVFALHHTTVANVMFILALKPFIAAVLSVSVLKERLSWMTWAAVLTCLIGVFIIARDGLEGGHAFGDALAFGAGLAVAVGIILIRHTGRDLSMIPGTAGLISALIALFFLKEFSMSEMQWVLISIDGLVVMPIAAALLALAPRYLPAPEVTIFHSAEVVLAPVWIWIAINEIPSPQTLIGGAIIIATLIVHSLYMLANSNAAPSPVRQRPG